MNKSDNIENLAKALSKAQGEIISIGRDETAMTGNRTYKYATLHATLKELKPIMKDNGLALTQFPTSNDEGRIGITNILMHTTGEWMEYSVFMDVPDSKQPAKEIGKVLTYLRRYSISGIFNIATDEDTDGEVKLKKAEKKPAKKSPRNLSPEDVKKGIATKAKSKKGTITAKSRKLIITAIVTSLNGDKTKAVSVLEYLTGFDKSADVPDATMLSIQDWLGLDNGAPSDDAISEIKEILRVAELDKAGIK